MANQSKCKFIINNIPTGSDLLEFAKSNKIDPDDLVFHGGEEYEFVFTASKKYMSLIKKNASLSKTHVIEIGYVTNGKGVFLEKQRKQIPLRDLGWHHFKK
jgi:thiamine-monophosphate kinase